MAKESKKRRRRGAKKEKKPTAVLRLRSDTGREYEVLYEQHYRFAAILLDQDIDVTVNGPHLDPSSHGPEMASAIKDFSDLRFKLARTGEQLKRELDEDGVSAGADLVTRLAIRRWLDPQVFEDLRIRLDEWRRKRERKQGGQQQEATEKTTPVDQANGDGAESDRTGVNESPLMDDPIANYELARLAKLDPTTVSRQLSSALGKAKVARKKVEPGHARWWSHRELRKAYPHLPDGKLQKRLNCIRM